MTKNSTDHTSATSTMKPHTNMYGEAKTWNPFKGCGFACSYCIPSFQLQAKRQKHNCRRCYDYVPHFHPERLDRIPSSPIVFVCGNGDFAFATRDQQGAIIAEIAKYCLRHPQKRFYLQSKRPECFLPHLATLPPGAVLVTTLETNRDRGYEVVSAKAPLPSERYRQFLGLRYRRKIVTIEPVMDFDTEEFASWIIKIAPELVYLGFNSRNSPMLPEPSPHKLAKLTGLITSAGIPIIGKTLRGLALPGVG